MKKINKYFQFLDNLRKSGVTNMFGAAPYLQEAYPELTREEAREILIKWMQSFGKNEREQNETKK